MDYQKISSHLLQFYTAVERLKATVRHSYTSDSSRKESVAEHTWMMTLLAITLFEYLKVKVDQLKILKMIIVHDLGECVHGDIPAFEKSKRQKDKKATEERVYKNLQAIIGGQFAEEMYELWQEFELNQTMESQVAQAIDKIEVLIQHNNADINTWEQSDYETNPYYRNELFDFNPFLRTLKDRVDKDTIENIEG